MSPMPNLSFKHVNAMAFFSVITMYVSYIKNYNKYFLIGAF